METESRTEAGAGESRRGGGEGAGTRRKLNEEQEREVTRLYAETDTPVSEISKRFGIGESSVYRVAQRHGAKLRGRTTSTSAAGGTAAATGGGAGGGRGRRGAGRPVAAGATPGASTGRAAAPGGTARRGRGAATVAGTTAGATATPAPSTNGRRRRTRWGTRTGHPCGCHGRPRWRTRARTRSKGGCRGWSNTGHSRCAYVPSELHRGACIHRQLDGRCHPPGGGRRSNRYHWRPAQRLTPSPSGRGLG